MKGLLKFITCGSVDDGKSTLIGHMLYDAKLLYADQVRALELESKVGSRGGELDYSLLLDGLMAEREQGITIDVAYRYFTTDNRSFIVADTPGHEEYTRNMAVGASFAELAVVLVDAQNGILSQTRRHATICAFMGIRYFIFAVNKMDLLGYSQERFEKLERDILSLANDLKLEHVTVIPVSATEGDNVTRHTDAMPWYRGRTLLEELETTDVDEKTEEGFLFPVQRVCRPDRTFRGFQGQIAVGSVSVGDEITVLPRGEKARVNGILRADQKVERAQKGWPVTLTLDREIDISRGAVLYRGTKLQVGNHFAASILWMDEVELTAGKSFFMKLGTRTAPVVVSKIHDKLDITTGERIPVNRIHKNEIAVCEIASTENVVFDDFGKHREMGRFILIDRITNMTSACGVVEPMRHKGKNLFWQEMDITREFRAGRMGQKPLTLWFTGLSGAGKSALANAVEKNLTMDGKYTMLLDGDNVRMGLNQDLGFNEADRIENIRRLAEVAKLMNDAGLIVLTSFISPYRSDRRRARDIIGNENFIEIYVSTPLEECERRDVKGLYRKARLGMIPNFTGINSPYEAPLKPEIQIDTTGMLPEDAVVYVLDELKKYM